jgi:multiple sugar transport system permease protein
MSFRHRMIVPLLALFAAAVGYPLVYSLYLSLTNYNITHPRTRRLVGLDQYVQVFQDPGYWSALRVTFTFVVLAVAIEFCLGMAIALALQRQRWARDFTRSFLLTPMFVTPIAVGLMFRFLLNQQLGVIPAVLAKLGVSYDFFGVGKALFSIVVIDAWQWTPFMVLLLLAGLESLPKQPFEAARVDGASSFYTFRRVTLPMMNSVIVVAILIRGLDAMKVFEYVYAITRGGPGIETETSQYFIYQTGITFYRLGRASAMAYVLLVIAMIAIVVLFRSHERASKR